MLMLKNRHSHFHLTEVEYCQSESRECMEEVYDCGGLVEQELTVHQSKGITCGDRGRTFAQDFVSEGHA